MRKALFTLLMSAVSLTAAAQYEKNDIIEGPANEKQDGKTQHTIVLSGGVSWITSKVYVDYDEKTWVTGGNFSLAYNCVYRGGYGFGVSYVRNMTSVDGCEIRANFIGPSVVYSTRVDMWRFSAEVGIGYAFCKMDGDNANGIGLKSAVAAEYLLSNHIGLMGQLGGVTSFLSGEIKNGRSNNINGISHWGVSLGLCVHF